MRRSILVLGFLFLASGAVAAHACEGSEVLFEDNFDTMEPAWGAEDDAFYRDNGQLVITPGLDEFYSALSNAGLYDDIDFCASVTAVKPDPAGHSYAGLIFWAIDYDNYYCVLISADGSAAIVRRQRGRTLTQLNYTSAPVLKTGPGAVNRIRVVTVGNLASIYLNGELFRQFKGQPPPNGQQIGVRATSPKDDRAVYAFDDIQVTLPGEPAGQ
jgi:hypothetical protein